jgi:glutamine cyclotransferase
MNTASYGQRQRSASGAGSISSQGSVSKMTNTNASTSNLAPFPTLLATSQSVLGQNLYDIMWKTFVAFEQDMRDCRWARSFDETFIF